MKDNEQENDDEMRPEYDFSNLRLVGRGIYAERYRAGVQFFIRDESDRVEDNELDKDNDEGGEH